MSSAKITMLGLETYLKSNNQSLFDDIVIPASIDKDTLVNSILLESAEFEVLYSNPSFMHQAIQLWFRKWNRTFTKWMEVLELKYNPLDNYDRTEEWSDKSGTSANGTVSDKSHGTTNENGSSFTNVSAYDSDTFEPSENSSSSSNASVDNKTDTTTESKTDTSSIHTGRVHGNIGVMSTQELINRELEVDKFNVYNHIVDMFLREFCLLIYD